MQLVIDVYEFNCEEMPRNEVYVMFIITLGNSSKGNGSADLQEVLQEPFES